MNKYILNTGIQNFIQKNLNTDISSLLLKKPIFDFLSNKELAEQIEAKKKCAKKLPTWFTTTNIYYPKKLSIEQTSSEITAKYKSEIINGKSIIDLTGGFGVDCFYFSKKFEDITHCEINTELSEIVTHNLKSLAVENIKTVAENGLDFIRKNPKKYDWIYIDPSRRNEAIGKVFFLEDCIPNVPENLELIFKTADAILIKTSPLLDISNGIKSLKFVENIHIVAVQNEVKELLWILKKDTKKEDIKINTINISKTKTEQFSFLFNDENNTEIEYSKPLKYLYEPNASILKSGAFKSVGKQYCLKKLAAHSHLYTTNEKIDFPGRSFEVIKTIPYSKKNIKEELTLKKANITTRNFPETVNQIRKKTKIKDGGNDFLFFTTIDTQKIIIQCVKNQ